MMCPFLIIAGLGLFSYFLGAIPCGYLLARLKGIDIRTVGSGNIGATNVFRAVSKPLGILTFILDALKGFVPAWLLPYIAQHQWHYAGDLTVLALVCAGLAIVGHNWPIYLRFKGGKGVATSAGALMGLAPAAAAVGLLTWVAVFVASRYVSVASISAAVVVVVSAWLIYVRAGLLIPGVLTALCALVILRHRANLQRLRAGTELRFQFHKPNQTGDQETK